MSLAAIPPNQPTLMEGASLALMEPYLDSLLKQALSRGENALLIPFANIQKFGTLNQRMIDALCELYSQNGWSVKVRHARAATPSGLLFECGRRATSKPVDLELVERESVKAQPREDLDAQPQKPPEGETPSTEAEPSEPANLKGEDESALQAQSKAPRREENQEGEREAESSEATKQEDSERGQ